MASIKLVLRKDQEDKTGHCPLYIRVIKDRKPKFISTGVKLKESEWDDEKQRIKKNHPNSTRQNASLAQKVADAEGELADLERKVKTFSANKLKEAIKGKDVPNFFDYSKKHCTRIKSRVSISTYNNYILYLDKFQKWVGTKDVFFDDITVTLLNDFLAYMGNELGNSATTQRYSIMILAIMFKEAIKEDIIPEYMYPFSKLTLTKDTAERLFLKKDQIGAMIDYPSEEGSLNCIYRDMFIFAIYAGGLRFSDVLEVQNKQFNEEEQKIKKAIRKTGNWHQFKIGKVALDIIKKYQKPNPQPEDFIFPIITNGDLFLKNEEYRYEFTQKKNKAANFQIQRIAKALDLPVHVSFHLSRHSFATNALNNGMRIEHVSKLMDHKDIRTTQVYAKILGEELDKAVDDFIY